MKIYFLDNINPRPVSNKVHIFLDHASNRILILEKLNTFTVPIAKNPKYTCQIGCCLLKKLRSEKYQVHRYTIMYLKNSIFLTIVYNHASVHDRATIWDHV